MADITLTPTNPFSSIFIATGTSDKGKLWLDANLYKHNVAARDLITEAHKVGLTVETDWSCCIKELVD